MADLTGVTQGFPGGTSQVYTTPFPMRPGQRARGLSGEEYVFVDFASTAYGRSVVQINSDYTASAITTTGRGPIGVVCTGVTSDNGGWVQIYGRCFVQIGINATSPSKTNNEPTTLSTSARTIFVLPTSANTHAGTLGYTSGQTSAGHPHVIMGISVATDASIGDVSATTSATSHIGTEVAVFLNYPHIAHQVFSQ